MVKLSKNKLKKLLQVVHINVMIILLLILNIQFVGAHNLEDIFGIIKTLVNTNHGYHKLLGTSLVNSKKNGSSIVLVSE